MVCIYCGSPTQVTNSRLQKKANQVWRRRLCTVCGNNFTTHEVAELGSGVVVQYSARNLQAFSRDTLFASIYESCKHRAKSVHDASALTLTIMSNLRDHIRGGVLERDTIVTVALAVLERFDRSAATMYEAYHPQSRK